MYRLITAVGMVAAICFALGCGSSGSDATSVSETVSKPLTKAELIKQATAICKANSKSRNAAFGTWSKQYSANPAGVSKHFGDAIKEVVAPSVGSKVEELGALVPPRQDAEKLDQMIGSLSKAQKRLEQNGQDGVVAADLQQFEREAAQYQRLATRYGLGACATP